MPRAPFAIVPLWVADPKVSTLTELRVYVTMAGRARARRLRRDMAALVEASGLSKTTVYDAVKVLRERGAVSVDGPFWVLPEEPEDSATAESTPGDNPVESLGESHDDSATTETGSATTEPLSSSLEVSPLVPPPLGRADVGRVLAEIREQIRRVGSYGSPCFQDDRTAAVARSLGRWNDLCAMADGDLATEVRRRVAPRGRVRS